MTIETEIGRLASAMERIASAAERLFTPGAVPLPAAAQSTDIYGNAERDPVPAAAQVEPTSTNPGSDQAPKRTRRTKEQIAADNAAAEAVKAAAEAAKAAGEAEKQAPPPVAPPMPAEGAAGPAPTLDELREKFVALAEAGHRPKLVELIKQAGGTNLSSVPADKYGWLALQLAKLAPPA